MKAPSLGSWPNDPPKAHRLMALIRSIAEHSGMVIFGEHAFDRLDERNNMNDVELNDLAALRVLRTGDIDGNIRSGDNHGEWVVKVIGPVNHLRGARNVGVVTIVLATDCLFVKTVEWEDKR